MEPRHTKQRAARAGGGRIARFWPMLLLAVVLLPALPVWAANTPVATAASTNLKTPTGGKTETFAGNRQLISNGNVIRIGKDFVIAAGTKHIGNILAFGGNIIVDGELNGQIIVVGGTVRISGTVDDGVAAWGGRVVLKPGAVVAGAVTAIGGGLERADGVELRSDVNSISLSQGLHVPRMRLYPFRPHTLGTYALYLIGLYITVLIMGYIFPSQLASVERVLQGTLWRSALVGTLALILVLPVTAVLILSIAGLPLVVLYWLAMGWACVLGYVGIARSVGRVVYLRSGLPARFPGGKGERPAVSRLLLYAAIGVLVLGILRAIPWLGPISGFVVLVCGLGAALRTHRGAAA